MSEQEIWKKVLEVAESEISKSTFNTFFERYRTQRNS